MVDPNDYIVNGKKGGRYKTSENFSFMQIFGAGHAVPKYGYKDFAPGEVALQMFNQIMFDGRLSAT